MKDCFYYSVSDCIYIPVLACKLHLLIDASQPATSSHSHLPHQVTPIFRVHTAKPSS